jgi:tetratricopeptide (TPR) repeat protein
MWRKAAVEFRQVGDTEGLAATSNNLGDVLLLQGDLHRARKLLEEAVPNYQAIEDKDGVARVLNDLAVLSWQKGELEAAETTYQQAKATAQEIDDKSRWPTSSAGWEIFSPIEAIWRRRTSPLKNL